MTASAINSSVVWATTPATALPSRADGDEMAQLDPPGPAGANGWTPAEIRVVRSGHRGGFLGSIWRYAVDPVVEHPGQRLSTAMIDAIAPYLAESYRVDEHLVRDHLARVYIYVGGPMDGGHMAMASDHHIFVPNEERLRKILSPAGTRWLVHELSHTMQFLAYDNGNRFRSMSGYIKGMVVGRDPIHPGTGDGPRVWGALFTGLERAAEPERDPGAPVTDIGGTFRLSLLPAAVVGGTTALTAAGVLSATRGLRARALQAPRVPRLNSLMVGAGVLAAPILGGAWLAASTPGDDTKTSVLAAAGGAAMAGLVALGSGYMLRGGSLPVSRWVRIGGAVGAAALGGLTAYTSARMTDNSLAGWSRGSQIIAQHRGELKETHSYMDALHDSHWAEVDAEAVAQGFRHWRAEQVAGGGPTAEGTDSSADAEAADAVAALRDPRDTTFGDRLDWGLYNPLIIGTPLALGAAVGVVGARAAADGIRLWRAPSPAREAGRQVGMILRGRGFNSLGTAAAVTLAPALLGAAVGSAAQATVAALEDNEDHPDRLSSGGFRVAALAGTVAAVGGAMLLMRMLNGRMPSGIVEKLPRLAGYGLAATIGTLAANASVRSTQNEPRIYHRPESLG